MECHAAFDEMVFKTFKTIAGIDGEVSQDTRLLTHLPQRDGGLGLQRYEFIGPIAYESSVETNPDEPDQETRTAEFNMKQVVPKLSEAATRHIENTSRWFASLWLSSYVPNRMGYAFGFALQHRVRFFGSKSSTQRCDGCNVELRHDQFDGHTLGCARRRGPAPSHRSARVVAQIANILRDQGLDVAQEVSITPDLRMDLVVYTRNGTQSWIDVTVFTTEGISTGRRTRDQNENRADTDKKRKYAEEALRQEATYETLAFDVHGSLSQKGVSVIKRLASQAEITSTELLRPTTHALQLANGEIIANARAAKDNKLRQKMCPLAPLRAAAPEYRQRDLDDEIEDAIAHERREQQLLSSAGAVLIPGDELDSDDYVLPRLRVAFPSLPSWRPAAWRQTALA
jgi:hypothetical protein